MKLQYLGTAAAEAIPALFCHCDTCRRARKLGGKDIRYRSGMMVNETAMIDFPPDAYALSVKLGLDLGAVRDIFVTHSHGDHFDAPDLFMRRSPVFCYLSGEGDDNRPVHLYGNDGVTKVLRAYEQIDGACDDFLDFTETTYFTPYTAENGVTFTHLPADHKPDERAGIYYFTDGNKQALYAHDTGVFPEETLAFLADKQLDFISLDCCYGKNSNRHGHMGLPQNREMVALLRQNGALRPEATVVVNHFSHNCGQLQAELEQEVKNDGFLVAYDGMIVTI